MKEQIKNKYKKKLLDNIKIIDDCWIWQKFKNNDGYGSIWVEDKIYRTHRLAYLLWIGEIPYNVCVCHKCDNRACINPDHLWIGSHIENMQDMVKKKRTLYGEQRPNNKIPICKRQEIVDKYLNGKTQTELAIEYNCHASAIWNAIHSILKEKRYGFKGERHPLAKLKEIDILEIRKRAKQGEHAKSIVKDYKVKIVTIIAIIKKRIWKHI